MKRTSRTTGRAGARLLAGTIALGLAAAAGPIRAVDTCMTPDPGDVYYVAYQNSPAGPEYIVDLGLKDQFLNATTKLTLPDIRAADFATIFAPSAPNLWVGFFGVRNPVTRDAIVSANGPKDQTALDNSSVIGTAQQIDSWATGLAQFASEIGGPPCSLNAGTFPGRVFGSYQDTLNGGAQGSIAGNLVWNVETRLSNSAGTRTATAKIRFFNSQSNPAAGTSSRSPIGYFKVFTDGSTQYWPDFDGDLLPDVSVGSDPEADKCPGVNSTDNTDTDNDNFAAPCDCNDANGTVWGIPNEVPGVAFAANKTTIGWGIPSSPGGTALAYDVFRGQQSSPGATPVYTCLSPNQAGTSVIDATTPAAGARPFLYLVRAQTSCGEGTVGVGQNAPARTVPSCP
jgi:hypothetical protein